MGFLDITGLDSVQEKQLLKEGRYNLLVESAEVKHNEKTGKDNIRVMLSAEGEANTMNIFHYLSLPAPSDEDDARAFKLLNLKRFMVQFGIPFDNGVNTETFAGARAACNVTVDEYEGRKNNKLVIDPLPVA